jgi:hypothetical protein
MKTILILFLAVTAAYADGPIGPIIKSPGPLKYQGYIKRFDARTRILQVTNAVTEAGFRVPGVVSISVPTEDALLRRGSRHGTDVDLKTGTRVTVTHLGSERLVSKIEILDVPGKAVK